MCYNNPEQTRTATAPPRETGFYYLQSRYYDPSIGRFVNADQFASTGQDFLGYNMFAYCNNSPVSNKDSEGTFLTAALAIGTKILTDGLIGGVIGAVTNAVCAFAVNGEITSSDLIEGFRDGFIGGALGKCSGWYNCFVAIKTTKECIDQGASFGASVVAGLVSLWAGAAFSNAGFDTFSESIFGLGMSLVSTGVTKGIQERSAGIQYNKQNNTVNNVTSETTRSTSTSKSVGKRNNIYQVALLQ